MRLLMLFVACLFLVGCSTSSQRGPTRIIKVLPQFLDQKGRVALNPSLYERDAYQAHLRTHRDERSGLRFAVQWRSRDLDKVKLRVEMRGNRASRGTTAQLEQDIKTRGLLSTWSVVALTGDAYREFGELSSWRATLWDGDQLVAEQTSFLW